MILPIAYGREGMCIDIPDSTPVIRSSFVPGLPDEAKAILNALRQPIQSLPLAQHVKRGDKVVIAHSDITRATPNDRLLPVLLQELEAAGVSPSDITMMNALGTHRPQTDAELRRMLGDSIFDQYCCLQHDAYDDSNLVSFGTTKLGHPVRLNRKVVEADFRILTGFIEPHFFAGFSGGPKGVLPALAGWESVFTNHSVKMLDHPKATWGITEGNPVWEEMYEMSQKLAPLFILNVTMNANHQITGVFAGDVRAAHSTGCEFSRRSVMVKVDSPFDVVVTTNSGYPLDQNLYQAVKGMSAANRIVRKGGAILMIAACEDGIPNHGKYAELLQRGGSPEGILKMIHQPGFQEQDQWEVQIQAKIQLNADVYVYSNGLTEQQIRESLFIPCINIPETLHQLQENYGPRLCVLPEGPQTIASLI